MYHATKVKTFWIPPTVFEYNLCRIVQFSSNHPNLSKISNYLSLTQGYDISCQDEDEGFLAPRAREKPEA